MPSSTQAAQAALTRLTKKILKTRGDILDTYKQELLKQPAEQRLALIQEVGNLVERHRDFAATGAHVQKEVIDNLTDEDYALMGVTSEAKETVFRYTTMLLPLVDIYNRCEERKKASKAEIGKFWGENWEEKMDDLLPPFCGETFLWDLCNYAKQNSWEIAEPYFRQQIQARRSQPYNKKYTWLQSRDITGKGTAGQKPRKSVRKPAPPNLLPSEIRSQSERATSSTPTNDTAGTEGNDTCYIIR